MMLRVLLPAIALVLAATAVPPAPAQSPAYNGQPSGGGRQTYNGRVTGNFRTHVFRYPWDPRQPPTALRIVFPSPLTASEQGYRPAPDSPPRPAPWRHPGEDAAGFGPEVNFVPRAGGTGMRDGRPPLHGPVTGDRQTHLFYTAWDPHYLPMASRVIFLTLDIAIRAGYRPAPDGLTADAHGVLLPPPPAPTGETPPVPIGGQLRPSREYTGPVTGNRRTKWYRLPWDPVQMQPANRVPFDSPEAARAAGYQPAPGSPAWQPSGWNGPPPPLSHVPGHGDYTGPVLGNPYTRCFICPGDNPAAGGPYTVRFGSVADAYRAKYFPVSPLLQGSPRAPSRF